MSKVLDKQTLDFGARFLQNLPQMDGGTMQDWIGNPALLQEELSGLAVSPFVVKVDRSVKPVYPDWVEKVIYPELENAGLAEFNLAKGVGLWLHEGQQNGGVTTGNLIYEHLRDNGMLPTCLNLQDGLAIQKKGIAVFRKFFGGKAILWKSVVQDRIGDLDVPYLCESGDRVVVRWLWLVNYFYGDNPAARFASNN